MKKTKKSDKTIPAVSSDLPLEKRVKADLMMPIRTIRNLHAKAGPIRSITRQGDIPLSFAQQRIWVFSQLNPNIPIFNTFKAYKINGPLNITRLEKSINEMLKRHEVLRMRFPNINGSPVPRISEYLTITLQEKDVSNQLKNQHDGKITDLCNKIIQQPIELTKGSILRVELMKTDSNQHILLLVSHQIIFDEVSWSIFKKELSLLYESFCYDKPYPLKKLPFQYIDFAAWQKELLQGEVRDILVSYWKSEFDGGFPLLDLPARQCSSKVLTKVGETHKFSLTKNLTSSLKELSKRAGVTLFTVLLATFKVLLSQYALQNDILVFTSVPSRVRAEFNKMIGLFSNFIPLRVDLAGNPKFNELLHRVYNVYMGALGHQDLPFEYILKEIQTEYKVNINSLFQVLFIFNNSTKKSLSLVDANIASLNLRTDLTKFDITLFVEETGNCLSGSIRYKPSMYSSSMIVQLIEHFQTMLRAIVIDPTQSITKLPGLTKAKRELIVATMVQDPKSLRPKHLDNTNKNIQLRPSFTKPRTRIESLVLKTWQSVLDVEKIDINDNFFDLGGNSLLLIILIRRLRSLLNRDVTIVEIFQYPTISSFVNHLENKNIDNSSFNHIHDRVNKRKIALLRRKK